MRFFSRVLIWIFAITQIMRNLTNVLYYFAYAGGFATGNYIGMVIEEKIALGNVLVRVISKNRFDTFIDFLKKHNYGATTLDAEGLHGDVKILFTVIPRTEIDLVVSFIKESNPQAFYTIEDVRFVNERKHYLGQIPQKNCIQTLLPQREITLSTHLFNSLLASGGSFDTTGPYSLSRRMPQSSHSA